MPILVKKLLSKTSKEATDDDFLKKLFQFYCKIYAIASVRHSSLGVYVWGFLTCISIPGRSNKEHDMTLYVIRFVS